MEEHLQDALELEASQHIATVHESSVWELRALALELELKRHKRLQRRVKK